MDGWNDGELDDAVAALEALLFTCAEPVPFEQLAACLSPQEPRRTELALDELARRLAEPHRGLELGQAAGGWRLATKPRFAELLQAFHRRVQRVRLSMASLETLGVIAYLQPVSTPEIEAIRGVSVQQTVHGLIDKGLVRIVGRKEAPGRPLLYGTTEQFLEHFGLADLAALPHNPELERWKTEFRSGSPGPGSAPGELVKPSSEPGA
jgi:segregation and condensation protein B